MDVCKELGWISDDVFLNSPTADINTLSRFHDVHYVAALKYADAQRKASISDRETYNFGTMENPIFDGVFARAATTVGGSIMAAEQALAGRVAFHPSGGTHHGRKDRASGFCYFNDPVFAILTFLDAGLDRVLYIDIDAHHGDGVEAAFTDDSRVATLSIHEEARWPHSGGMNTQSAGQINLPVPQGLNDTEFDYIMDELVLPYCGRFKPQAIVITCGADGLKDDPLSKMCLSNGALWQAVLKLCDQSPSNVVLGGGGYNPWTTVRCWAGLWGQIAGFEMPETLPEGAQNILARFDSDLIDEEDRSPQWITDLCDAPNQGAIRDEIKSRVAVLNSQSSPKRNMEASYG